MSTHVHNEVVRLLRRVIADRNLAHRTAPPWGHELFFSFKVDGWELCLFNDAGAPDYIEWARDPEGKVTPFEKLYEAGKRCDPIDKLTKDEQDRLAAIVRTM
jgi:hypothetical protein